MLDSSNTHRTTVGIVGFGAFGRLAARHLRAHFRLYAFDPALPPNGREEGLGVIFGEPRAVARCDVVVLAMPVEQLGPAIAAIRPHLRPGALVLDVGSVKAVPARIMRRELPEHVEVIGTHPLFGPQSARGGIKGLKIVLCPIRGRSAPRVAAFLRTRLGLKVFFATPEAHDEDAALVQGLTHFIANVLVRMEPLPTRITTMSFDLLMEAVEMVRHDAPELLLAIERLNPRSARIRERFLEVAAELNAAWCGGGAHCGGRPPTPALDPARRRPVTPKSDQTR